MALKTNVLMSAVVALLLLTSGCLGGDEEPEVKVELTLMGEEAQNVVQGNNTTFLFEVDNQWKEDATLIMSTGHVPEDWSVEFLPERVTLDKHTSTGVRMNVSVPTDASLKGHNIKVTVRGQGSDIHKDSVTVTVFALSSTIGHNLEVVTPGGDTVYVNYTGYLTNGSVFDTTYEEIGISEGIEKAPSWVPKSTYDPAPFHPGQGELVPGFEAGFTNMRKGEYKTFFVPKEQAYSRYEERTINLTETVPLQEEWSNSEFQRAFRQEPAMWMLVTHRKWNWTAQVVAIDGDDEAGTVTLELIVSPGDVTETYGWESEVVSVDSTANGGVGEIVLRNHPGEVGSEAQIYNVTAPKEYDYGKVIEVTDDTVTVRVQTSHHLLAGQDLIFNVKIHDIQPA